MDPNKVYNEVYKKASSLKLHDVVLTGGSKKIKKEISKIQKTDTTLGEKVTIYFKDGEIKSILGNSVLRVITKKYYSSKELKLINKYKDYGNWPEKDGYVVKKIGPKNFTLVSEKEFRKDKDKENKNIYPTKVRFHNLLFALEELDLFINNKIDSLL